MALKSIVLKGDYSKREYDANAARCAAVFHWHLNSVESPKPTYALVEVAHPVTPREMRCARDIAASCAKLLGGGLGSGDGVKVLEDGDRAEYIIDGNREAYILEPLFCSNPEQAAWIAKPENQKALAAVIAGAIARHYPNGSVIGQSVGHKYKTTAPNDRGARVVGTKLSEADCTEPMVAEAVRILGAQVPPVTPSKPRMPLLRRGSKGGAVRTLQTALNKAGARPRLVVDGDFGAKTDAAVRAFQKRKGLAADGIVGSRTWKALGY